MHGSHHWKYEHHQPKFPKILVLLFLLFLFTGGLQWLILPALFLIPMMFIGKCGQGWNFHDESGKRKNDEKRKHGDSPFYDVEII
jgi:hypothetical protein